MKKIVTSVIILVIVVVLANTMGFNQRIAEAKFSDIQGSIYTNQTWTKTSSPYTLTDTVKIEDGATLTIEPGVTINLNSNVLEVWGTLIAQGSSIEKIQFNSVSNGGTLIFYSDGTTQNRSIIENCIFGRLTTLDVDSSSPAISKNLVDGNFYLNGGNPQVDGNSIDTRLFVKGGTPVISNNIITDGIHADARGGPATITNNNLTSKSGFTVIYAQGIHADIYGNRIIGVNSVGIEVWLRISSASIIDNEISNCTSGIRADAGQSNQDLQIVKNCLFNNTLGLYFWAYGDIHDNTIEQNVDGIAGATYFEKIQNNNIANNSRYNFRQLHLRDGDASRNWWGTTDPQLINQTIYDKKNESLLGQVNFAPFLTAPNPQAPEIPTNVTPITLTKNGSLMANQLSPIILILVVTLLLIFGFLVFYYKRRKKPKTI